MKKLVLHHGRLIYPKVQSSIPRKPNNISEIPPPKNDEQIEKLHEVMENPTSTWEDIKEVITEVIDSSRVEEKLAADIPEPPPIPKKKKRKSTIQE